MIGTSAERDLLKIRNLVEFRTKTKVRVMTIWLWAAIWQSRYRLFSRVRPILPLAMGYLGRLMVRAIWLFG